MTAWRLLHDDGVSAADGLAMDEALLHEFHRDRCGDTPGRSSLRLYTYRPHCALVGRHQDLSAELDREACRRLGIEVGRRPTGGGAIIMGPGQLGIAVATGAPVDRSPREILQVCAEGVIRGLATLGVEASFRGKNDLEVGERKIAGLGLHLDQHGGLLFHASVLADLDVPLLLEVLRIPGAKLAGHGVARVQERITTVTRELGRPVTAADLRASMAAGFAAALDVDLEMASVSETERDTATGLADRHRSAAWLDQLGGRIDAHASALVRTPDGLLRIYVGVQGAALSSVMVTGDVSVLPPSVARAEALLRWLPAEPDLILDVLQEAVEPDVLQVGPRPIADGIWAAAREAMERSGSLPLRLRGSCYFPDREAGAPVSALVSTERA